MIDEKRCSETEFRYGEITKRVVLYNGEDSEVGNVSYRNIASYLEGLRAY